jgi:aromatic-amino-acid transaminase
MPLHWIDSGAKWMEIVPSMLKSRPSFFETLTVQPPDPLLSLIRMFDADPRPQKLDLGVGVYRDDTGTTPILAAIKIAEGQLLAEQVTKGYLGQEGNFDFLDAIRALLFPQGGSADWFAVQTPGGCGALRMAAELAAAARSGARIWMGTPTWPNHGQTFEAAGLTLAPYRVFEPRVGQFDFEAMMQALGRAEAGDLALLQGCCHNPTGADPTPAQWREIAALLAERDIVPLIDLAYHGLATGLEDDLVGFQIVGAAVDEVLLAYSCDKNFGLYRERTGALFARSRGQQARVSSNLLKTARESWSMPPDHGAAAVAKVLGSEDLTKLWREELAGMRDRLRTLRKSLAAASPVFERLTSQHGLFAQLPLSSSEIEQLRVEDAIYMTGSGRINIAGLGLADVDRFARAVEGVIRP